MRRLNIDVLEPGDIVFTARRSVSSKLIRAGTAGQVSHVLVCLQHGSLIDATPEGVMARNMQRELFQNNEQVWVYRLRQTPSIKARVRITEELRMAAGGRYSVIEAARTVFRHTCRPRLPQQFCSRLIARAYDNAGICLVADPDYCTPEELRHSPHLVEVTDVLVELTADDLSQLRTSFDLTRLMQIVQKNVLQDVRQLEPKVEVFNDVVRLVRRHTELDAKIAQILVSSGYFEVWKHDLVQNPWAYDLARMRASASDRRIAELRQYCVGTIKEMWTGGLRFVSMLNYYRHLSRMERSLTVELMVKLYSDLALFDRQRRDIAKAWLDEDSPELVKRYLEVACPHSKLWFEIMGKVEPYIAAIARSHVRVARTKRVCSMCGDPPVGDFQFLQGGNVLLGVPSLRLCVRCIDIQEKQDAKMQPC